MPAPNTSLDWALNNVAEYIQDEDGGGTILVVNKEEPSEATKQSGVRARQPHIRNYYNYMLNSFGEWIKYLRDSVVGSQVGDIYTSADLTTTRTDIEDRFGGTWDDIGTDVLAGLAVRIFRRTS